MNLSLSTGPIRTISKPLFAITLALILTFAAYGQAKRPTVMILGVSHMNNPKRDVVNVGWDDVLSAKRQQEIGDLIELLKRFKPTKIALESSSSSTKLDERYGQYLKGEYELTRNEIDQIGLRLAKAMGHKQIYGVDDDSYSQALGRVFEYAKSHDQQAMVDRAFDATRENAERIDRLIRTTTVTDILRYINEPERIDESNRVYMQLLRIGGGTDYPGVDAAAEWHTRNLTITANIMRITESNNDRILVIFGAGHSKLLQQFLSDSREYELVSAGEFLRQGK